MSYSINGSQVFEACVCLPRSGAWTAEVCAEGELALSGHVALELGGLSLRGTVVRSGLVGRVQRTRIVGGAGGLTKLVEPKQYVRVPVGFVVRELLRAAGEQLSARADAALLETMVESWVVTRQTLGEALGAIARRLGAVWRVESSGEVWMGVDAYPAVELENATLMAEFPAEGRQVWGVERPMLMPGVSVKGRRVVQVQHHCSSNGMRTEVWWGA